jgi:hypothetical protein
LTARLRVDERVAAGGFLDVSTSDQGTGLNTSRRNLSRQFLLGLLARRLGDCGHQTHIKDEQHHRREHKLGLHAISFRFISLVETRW